MSKLSHKFYETFSGTDTIAFIMLPNTAPIVLGTLTTLSYSTYREKKPVNILGKINVNGYTRGVRTVAGTMIFTLINQHWVNELVKEVKSLESFHSIKGDELPLFDIMLISANEYGSVVKGFIYGVDIIGDGGVISVEDMFSENTINYVARDIDLLTDVNPLISQLSMRGQSTPNSSNVYLKGLNNFEYNDELVSRKNRLRSIDSYKKNNQTNLKNISIDINNLDMEQTIIDKDRENIISVISYYPNKNKDFIKTVNGEVKIKDIVNAFLYDIKEKSCPTSIDVITKDNNIIYKYVLKIN